MNSKYINIYNNLVNLTRNKELYKNFQNKIHFQIDSSFFYCILASFWRYLRKIMIAKFYKTLYDYQFRQLELSIREIGYGDQSINKKMKDYLNLFLQHDR